MTEFDTPEAYIAHLHRYGVRPARTDHVKALAKLDAADPQDEEFRIISAEQKRARCTEAIAIFDRMLATDDLAALLALELEDQQSWLAPVSDQFRAKARATWETRTLTDLDAALAKWPDHPALVKARDAVLGGRV